MSEVPQYHRNCSLDAEQVGSAYQAKFIRGFIQRHAGFATKNTTHLLFHYVYDKSFISENYSSSIMNGKLFKFNYEVFKFNYCILKETIPGFRSKVRRLC